MPSAQDYITVTVLNFTTYSLIISSQLGTNIFTSMLSCAQLPYVINPIIPQPVLNYLEGSLDNNYNLDTYFGQSTVCQSPLQIQSEFQNSFNSNNGIYNFSSNGILNILPQAIGSYIIPVSFMLNSGQQVIQQFAFNGLSTNTTPQMNTSRSNISVMVGQQAQYILPIVTLYPNQNVIGIIEQAIPDFIQFNNNTLTIHPMNQQDSGIYKLEVTLKDVNLQTYSTYFINIQILPISSVIQEITSQLSNIGPPVFNGNIQLQFYLEPGSQISYQLPNISDPDNDKFVVDCNINDAISFIEFSTTTNTLTITPSVSDQRSSPYIIKITLTDINTYPKSSQYQISVIVSQNATQKQGSSSIEQKTLAEVQSSSPLSAILQSATFDGILTVVFSESLVVPQNYTMLNKAALDIYVLPANLADSQNKNISSWVISSFTESEMIFQINFTNPSAISPRITEEDLICICFIGNQNFKSVTDSKYIPFQYNVTGLLPQQIIYTKAIKTMKDVAQVGTQSLIYGVITNAALQIFLQSLAYTDNMVWGMMNTLQLISYFLKFNLVVPDNAYLFFFYINDFLNMRSQLIDKWILQISQKLVGFESSMDSQLIKQSSILDNSNFLQSMGTLFICLCGIIIAMLFAGIVAISIRKFTIGKKLGDFLKHKLFFNSIGRFMIQSYFKFSLIACTSILTFDCSTKEGLLNGVIGITLSILVISFPVLVYLFLRSNRHNLCQENVKIRFDSLYLGLNTTIDGALYMTVLFLIRRLYLAVLIIAAGQSQFPQIFGMQLFSLGMIVSYMYFQKLKYYLYINIVFLTMVKPYELGYMNALEIFNEFLLFLCATLTLAFSDMTSLAEESKLGVSQAQSNIGWVYIGISIMNILVTLSCILFQIHVKVWPIIKDKVSKLRGLDRVKKFTVPETNIQDSKWPEKVTDLCHKGNYIPDNYIKYIKDVYYNSFYKLVVPYMFQRHHFLHFI